MTSTMGAMICLEGWDMISNDRETELELIRLAQAGDQRAFRQLIQEAHSRMWAVCLSTTGNRHDAEDALQNALTSIWRNIGKFEPRAKFSTWAYRIASNAALHVIRSRRDTLDADAGMSEPDKYSLVDDQVTASIVIRRALQTLSPEFKEAIILREYAGMNYQEIAEHQQVGVQTVKSRLNRARTRLREALEEAGVTRA